MCSKAALDDIEALFVVAILDIRILHVNLGKNSNELEEAFGWVLEAGLLVCARTILYMNSPTSISDPEYN